MLMTLQQALDYVNFARAQMLKLAVTTNHLAVIQDTDGTVLRFLAGEVVAFRTRLAVTMVAMVFALALCVTLAATK